MKFSSSLRPVLLSLAISLTLPTVAQAQQKYPSKPLR